MLWSTLVVEGVFVDRVACFWPFGGFVGTNALAITVRSKECNQIE